MSEVGHFANLETVNTMKNKVEYKVNEKYVLLLKRYVKIINNKNEKNDTTNK